MKKLLLALLLAVMTATSAFSQVRQSGNVTPGHVPMWTTNGVIQDGGTAVQGFLTSLGVTNNSGPGICINSAPITAPYNQLCFAASTSAAAKVTLQNYGGATAQRLDFIINGVNYPFPGPGTGDVLGPGASTIGHLVVWNDALGVLVADGGAPPAINIQAAPYNAVGDCATNDTAAIQAAVTASVNAGGVPVYIPPVASCYLTSSEITIAGRTTIYGAAWSRLIGEGGSFIKTNSASNNVFNIPETVNGVTFSNFAIGATVARSTGTGTAVGAGVRITCVTCASSLVPFGIFFDKMGIFDQKIGIDGENASTVWIKNSTISSSITANATGILLANAHNTDAGEHWVCGNFIGGGNDTGFVGLNVVSGGGVRVENNKFISGNTGLLFSTPSGATVQSIIFNVVGNSFDEQSSYGIRATNSNVGDVIRDFVISSNVFTGPATTYISVVGSSVNTFGYININGNTFNNRLDGGNGINITGASELLIDGNVMAGINGTAITIGSVVDNRIGLGNLYIGWTTNVSGGGFSNGSIIFTAAGMPIQDNANLSWDVTNHRLTATTINAFTLNGTISGGGNQLNNIIIGTTTPLAGSFTTLSGTSLTLSADAQFVGGGVNHALYTNDATGQLNFRTGGSGTMNFAPDTQTGNITFFATKVVFGNGGAVSMTGLPTSAGAGGIFVCVDTAGVLYKKATCP